MANDLSKDCAEDMINRLIPDNYKGQTRALNTYVTACSGHNGVV